MKPISDETLRKLLESDNPKRMLFNQMKQTPLQTVYSHMNMSFERFKQFYDEWESKVNKLHVNDVFENTKVFYDLQELLFCLRADEYMSFKYLIKHLDNE